MIIFLIIVVYLVVGWPITRLCIWVDEKIEGPGFGNGEALFTHAIWPISLVTMILFAIILAFCWIFPEGTGKKFFSKLYGIGR